MDKFLVPGSAQYKTDVGTDFFEEFNPGVLFYRRIKNASLQIGRSTESTGVLRINIVDNDFSWGGFFPSFNSKFSQTMYMYLGAPPILRRVFHGQMRTPPLPDYGKDGLVSISFVFYGQFSRKKYDLAIPRKWPLIAEDTKPGKVITLYRVLEQLCERNGWLFVPKDGSEYFLLHIQYSALFPLHQNEKSSDYEFIVETCALWGLGVNLKYTDATGSDYKLTVFSKLGAPIALKGDNLSTAVLRNYLMIMNTAVVNKGMKPSTGKVRSVSFEYAPFNVSYGPDGIIIEINKDQNLESVSAGEKDIVVDHEFIFWPYGELTTNAYRLADGPGIKRHKIRAVSGMKWKQTTIKDQEAYRKMVRTVRRVWFDNVSGVATEFSKLKFSQNSVSPQKFLEFLFGVKSSAAGDLDFNAAFGVESKTPAPMFDPLSDEIGRVNRGGDHYVFEMSLTCDGCECIDEGQWGIVTGFYKWMQSYSFYISSVTHNLGDQQFTTSLTLQAHGVSRKLK